MVLVEPLEDLFFDGDFADLEAINDFWDFDEEHRAQKEVSKAKRD